MLFAVPGLLKWLVKKLKTRGQRCFTKQQTACRLPKGPKMPLTLTFKLVRVTDQIRLPCEFGASVNVAIFSVAQIVKLLQSARKCVR